MIELCVFVLFGNQNNKIKGHAMGLWSKVVIYRDTWVGNDNQHTSMKRSLVGMVQYRTQTRWCHNRARRAMKTCLLRIALTKTK
jgi:hypothetical protein